MDSTNLDLDLLDVLRCVECGHSGFNVLAERLVCASCNASFDVHAPGIPRMVTGDSLRRSSIHEQQWDNMPQADYDQICRENRCVWEAIDGLVMKYCSGLVLEVCCGNGRFLDVLTQNPNVKRAAGLDISIGMLRTAWDRGHRGLMQASADDLPIRNGAMDTVASSGSGLSFVQREQTYSEVARILKPQGFFVFDLLNFWPSVIDNVWWQYVSNGRLPRMETLSGYKLAGNMRDAKLEVELLSAAGFQIVEMKSVRYLPFFRGRLQNLGYWPGFWGARLGYDTIFICRKVRG
jgi:ubiquinone/menaquinone biosynthesis C-methylase UbiE/uncharacterized protein YbaR (Trm112 family)